jgi:gamma-glutamylcyclotransferase (GGCT)/AIG2-like uncharacterized protein YtfP
MSLLSSGKALVHLQEALIHFNAALDGRAAGHSSVDVARALFDGLNKLQTEWAFLNPISNSPGEVTLCELMFLDLLKADARSDLLQSHEMGALFDLQPPIVSRTVHENLVTASGESQGSESPESEERVVQWTAQLLCNVRSNIAHGDVAKRERDEQVCACVVPLQLLLFDLLLESPSGRLLVYGTLAPGEANHGIISGVPGEWAPCRVNGTIARQNGLPYLTWNPAGAALPAQLFTSSELPNAWNQLDDFEGEEYKRRLVSIETDRGVSTAYAYLDARPMHDR